MRSFKTGNAPMLAVSSFLLGLLTAFMLWALTLALDARQDLTYGMPDKSTVLDFEGSSREPEESKLPFDQSQLRDFLDRESLTLIAATVGEGEPSLVVHDPQRRVGWFPEIDEKTYDSQVPEVFTFIGSYSEDLQKRQKKLPYLESAEFGTPINPPREASELQYARPLQNVRLTPGTYVVNTNNPLLIEKLTKLLHRQNLEPNRVQDISLLWYLSQNPLLIVTTLFLVLAYLSTVILWGLHSTTGSREYGILARHGASATTIFRRKFHVGLPAIAAGQTLGVLASLTLVRSVSGIPISFEQAQFMILPLMLGTAGVIAIWALTLFIAIVRRYDANLGA